MRATPEFRRYLVIGFGAGLALATLVLVRTPLFRGEIFARRTAPTRADAVTPYLTKDEVLRVGARGLSLIGYENLRRSLPDCTREEALWVATAALELVNERPELDPDTAVQAARYAVGRLPGAAADRSIRLAFGLSEHAPLPLPSELRARVDGALTHAAVLKNLQLLAEIR